MSAANKKNVDDISNFERGHRSEKWDEQLPALIYAEADRRGLSLQVVAEMLGMSRPYLFRLRHYPPSCKTLSRNYIDQIAVFLGIPVIAVMVAAGQLRAEDLSIRDGESRQEVDRAIEYMKGDPLWSAMLTGTERLNDGLKLLIVRCYEREEGKKILSDQAGRSSLFNILFPEKTDDGSVKPPAISRES